jgi:hypothetical protein
MEHKLLERGVAYDLMCVAELKMLCGPPPVLTSESVKAYYRMMLHLLQSFRPRDFMERMFIRHLTDSSWEVLRYTRHKSLLMERKCRPLLEHRAQHLNAAEQNQEEQVRAPAAANGNGKPPDAVHTAPGHVALLRRPTALDHADALEHGIEYAERLDKLLNAATARRDDVLEQFHQYRDRLSGPVQRRPDRIFDESSARGRGVFSDEVYALSELAELLGLATEVAQAETSPASATEVTRSEAAPASPSSEAKQCPEAKQDEMPPPSSAED